MDTGEVPDSGPHFIYRYPKDMSVLYDVNDIVIHYVKRQPNIQKEEKRHAKRYLKRFIPELFNVPQQSLSDEEDTNEGGPGLLRAVLSCLLYRTVSVLDYQASTEEAFFSERNK